MTIEMFADVVCPFTHIGLGRITERRDVKAWPLELVNGEPLFVAAAMGS